MIKYKDFALSNTVEEILKEDFWVFTGYKAWMLRYTSEPIKFSATASVYLSRGKAKIQLSLRPHEVVAPAVVMIREGKILQLIECSDDMEASFCVMSKHFIESMFGMLKDLSIHSMVHRSPIVALPEADAPAYDFFYRQIKVLSEDKSIARRFPCLLHTVLAFYYKTGIKAYVDSADHRGDASTRLTDSFLYLVQLHFKEERFLDFYAAKLGITPKHLSRVVKSRTGLSPIDWIDRYVILEAKVLLRSSTMSIQQISDNLNFSSQSFFGKHFKKQTGKTPGEFRNM